jgi:Fic family protein
MWEELKNIRHQYLNLNLQDNIDYEKFSLISIVYNSSKIEGCSLDETDTRVLIEDNITAKGKPLSDHLMVKDHFEAFVFLKDQARQKRPVTVDFLKEVTALTMKNTGSLVKTINGEFDSSKGDLRLAQVYVDQKYFPDFKKVPDLLGQLCQSVNNRLSHVSEDESLKLAADFHYNLVNIHPWADGNGRVSRLMMNYVQLYHHEPLIKIFTEDRADYIRALNETEENNNPEIFRKFVTLQQIKFLQSEIDKYKNIGKGFHLLF